MADARLKKGVFSKIETKDDALKVIRDAAIGFFCVAGLQGGIGFFFAPTLVVDAVVIAVLAFLLIAWKLRTAAVLLLIYAGITTITTVLAKVGVLSQGGTNIGLVLVILWAGIRATEATFKLRGRFAKESA